MRRSAFDPSIDDLPATVPIFPLPGALLLPGGKLPLNIFEPRYLSMTQDALATPQRLIGMIQPRGGDGARPGGAVETEAAAEPAADGVYAVGCAGRVSSFSETSDGRFLITLHGVARFRVASELPTVRGYRRVQCDWAPFGDDLGTPERISLDRERLYRGLKRYFERHDLTCDWNALREAPDVRLITSLSMICPFEPSEKQALLEAPDLESRAQLMIGLIEIGAMDRGDEAARH